MWVFKTFHNDFLDFPGISRFVNLGLLSLLLNLVKNFSIFFISFKESSLCSYESSFCLHFISFYLNVCYCLPHTTLTFAFTFFFFVFCLDHWDVSFRCSWFLFWLVESWLFFSSSPTWDLLACFDEYAEFVSYHSFA